VEQFLSSLGVEDAPSDLIQFCDGAMKKCMTDRDKKFIVQYLTTLIKQHVSNDTVLSHDWESIPVPS